MFRALTHRGALHTLAGTGAGSQPYHKMTAPKGTKQRAAGSCLQGEPPTALLRERLRRGVDHGLAVQLLEDGQIQPIGRGDVGLGGYQIPP